VDIVISGDGNVNLSDGWYAYGTVITATAMPAAYYTFNGWSGDIEGDTNSSSAVILIDRPKTIVAHFEPILTTNNIPVAWLAEYKLTNSSPEIEAMSDHDNDGMLTWQEFYAGTDPTNSASRFAIIDAGRLNNSNYIVWFGGTNGSKIPFTVMGTTNLLDAWFEVATNISRSNTGTNIWWDIDERTNIFYRIQVNIPR
jgi:hypothetical protein